MADSPLMATWSDAEIGRSVFIVLLVGLTLAQGVYCWRALRRTTTQAALPAGGRYPRVPLVACLWFGLAGAQWAGMRSGWLPNASPFLPLVGVVMGLGTLIRRSLERHGQPVVDAAPNR